MRILSRYFLLNYLFLVVTILVVSTIAIVIVETLLNFSDIVDQHKDSASIATYLFLRVPAFYLRDLIPVASFSAALFGLGIPARALEITAIKSGGISPQRSVVSLLGAAAVLSAAALLVNETLVLEATREWNQRTNPGGEIAFRQGSFWYHRGNAVYNVNKADLGSRTLSGVRVFELSPAGRLLKSIQAERVEVGGDNRWRFFDATARTFDPTQPATPPHTKRLEKWDRDVTAEKDLALLEASATTLSLLDLRKYIDAQARQGRDTRRYQALLHARMAAPVTVFLFALLAIPLALSVEHSRSLAVPALYGTALLASFFAMRTIADLFAISGYGSAVISPWLILTGFGGYGIWQLARVAR